MIFTDDQQLELFDADRWPRKPYCTDDLEAGLRVRSLLHALKKPYIQANPPHLRVWSIFDIDRPGAALAWEDAGLPPPSWTAVNKENGHAHSVWGLRAPVLVEACRHVKGREMRTEPLRYLCAIESMFRIGLRADNGFSGLITKNPIHPLWRTLRGPRLAYDLSELGEYLPGLEQHFPKKKVEQIGLGRNVTLFDELRQWAYKAVRQYQGEGGLTGWNAWMSAANSRALVYNGDFQTPLHFREVWHIAKSVAKWTWKRFDVVASDEKFAKLQEHRGKLGAAKRWGNNEDKVASARIMAAAGRTVREIAEELDVGKSTVARWLND